MPTAAYKTCFFCAKEVKEEELENHQLVCREEEVECGNECGIKLPRQMLSEHLKDSCRKRKVLCRRCRQTYLQEDLENHKVHCFVQFVQSVFKCSEQTDHTSMSKPLNEESSESSTTYDQEHGQKCKMSVHSCDICSKQVNPEDMDIHLKEKCVVREVECVFCDSFVQEDSLAKHYDICESALVRCGNKCGVKISRKDLSEHYRNECPKTLLVCEHCEKKVERQLLEDHHAKCLKFPIPCPQSCDVVVAREDEERHLDEECQKLFAACAYKGMQCGYEGFPAGMRQHMKENMQHHIDLIKVVVENLQMELKNEMKRNEELQIEIRELRQDSV